MTQQSARRSRGTARRTLRRTRANTPWIRKRVVYGRVPHPAVHVRQKHSKIFEGIAPTDHPPGSVSICVRPGAPLYVRARQVTTTPPTRPTSPARLITTSAQGYCVVRNTVPPTRVCVWITSRFASAESPSTSHRVSHLVNARPPLPLPAPTRCFNPHLADEGTRRRSWHPSPLGSLSCLALSRSLPRALQDCRCDAATRHLSLSRPL